VVRRAGEPLDAVEVGDALDADAHDGIADHAQIAALSIGRARRRRLDADAVLAAPAIFAVHVRDAVDAVAAPGVTHLTRTLTAAPARDDGHAGSGDADFAFPEAIDVAHALDAFASCSITHEIVRRTVSGADAGTAHGASFAGDEGQRKERDAGTGITEFHLDLSDTTVLSVDIRGSRAHLPGPAVKPLRIPLGSPP